MNKKILFSGVAALLVVGGIGYSIFSQSGEATPNTMKGSLFAVNPPSIVVDQRVQGVAAQSRTGMINEFNSSLANLAIVVTKYKAGALLMGSCSPRAVEFSQNIATADTATRSLISTLNTRIAGQQNYLEANFTNNTASIRSNMSAISTSITMADALLRTVDFSNASACSTLPVEVRNFVYPGVNNANGSSIIWLMNAVNSTYTRLTR